MLLGGFQSVRLNVLVVWGLYFIDAVFACCVFCNILEFVFYHMLSVCAGSVAPVLPVRDPLQLILLVVNSILVILGHLRGFYILPKF